MKVSIKHGKIWNQTTMRKQLTRFSEVWIVDETDGFRADRERIYEQYPDMGPVFHRRTNLGFEKEQ